MKKKNDTKLLQIIFYLAPGDYHKYHSPIDFVARKRLHIPGYLYPVKISFLEKYKVTLINIRNYMKIMKEFVYLEKAKMDYYR